MADFEGRPKGKATKPQRVPNWDRIARGDPYFGSREMPIKYPYWERIGEDGKRKDPKPENKYPSGSYVLVGVLVEGRGYVDYWFHTLARQRAKLDKYCIPDKAGTDGS